MRKLMIQPNILILNEINVIVPVLAMICIIACGPPPPPKQKESAATPTPQVSVVQPGIKDTAYFLNRLTDFSQLAEAHPNETMVLRSSHNPDNQPEDADQFEGTYKLENDDVEWKVLLDEKGPGCVTRMWLSGHLNGRLRLYFDNEVKPTIEADIRDFFSGKYKSHFSPLLVYGPDQSGYGNISYFPLAFENHITVMTDSTQSNIRYQFNVLKFEKGEGVLTYNNDLGPRAQIALEETQATLDSKSYNRFFSSMPLKRVETTSIEPNSRRMMINTHGPAALDFFIMKFKSLSVEALKGLHLQIFWDDLSEPAVDCTLYDFFCHTETDKTWTNLFLGMSPQDNRIFSRFYMPFLKRAQLFLENKSENEITLSLDYHIDVKNIPLEPLYFFARPMKRTLVLGHLYPFLNVEGEGNFIGWNLHVQTDPMKPAYFYLDGDEFFYVDGEPKPSWSGTGMDNYFNGDLYFRDMAYFFTPTHGCLNRTLNDEAVSSNKFRFHLLDAIPFEKSILLVQEIGCPIKYASLKEIQDAEVEWTCFWYGKPASQSVHRQENLAYFVLSEKPEGQPNTSAPLMKDGQLSLKLPDGRWYIHYAPFNNMSMVQHKLVQDK